jgi:hypothetical protein
MDGIILTTGVGGGGTSTSLFEATIAPSDIEALDVYEADPCPTMKWLVTLHDLTTDDTRSFQVHALHDFNGNITHNISSAIGSVIDHNVTVSAGPNPNELLLAIENLSSNTIDVCAYRIV